MADLRSRRFRRWLRLGCLGILAIGFVAGSASFPRAVQLPAGVIDADLVVASGGRTIRLGSASGASRPLILPLEVYVARVLAGEAEPRAADEAYQALAIAIRTFAMANPGRHEGQGFDLCDGTHCQVPRAATATTRRAALVTAGQILTRNGVPAEVFYSASCGGQSESADQVWPGADLPYMPSAPDDVHQDDEPWTVEFTLEEIERALASVGFDGHLSAVRVDVRNESGRAARLQVVGLRPDVIAGNRFRAAIGSATLRSAAFTIDQEGRTVRFTGRGYGHGVGLCVVGAGRWAVRGESAAAILARYFPGLELSRMSGGPPVTRASPGAVSRSAYAGPTDTTSLGGIAVEVGLSSGVTADQIARLARTAVSDLATALGVPVAPIGIRVHESIESFRAATGRPWWVSSVSDGGSIDLVPTGLLAQREGVETALRIGVADAMLSGALRGRPLWVRVGAARYFGRASEALAPRGIPPGGCPADVELTLAISAAAQRDAESRAESCFAREYARTGDWRAVR